MAGRAARNVEAAVVLGVLLAIGLVLLPAAVDAWWAADDWAVAELVARRGYASAVRDSMANFGSKPLLAIAQPAPYALFGTDPGTAHAVVTVGLGVATAAALHVLLRRLGFGPWEAAAAAVLTMVFPWNISSRLWLAASTGQLAVLSLVLGMLASLQAFGSAGRRAAALHAIGAGLLVASILTYEATAAVAVLSGALYLTVAPARPALARWAVDVVACGAAIAWSMASSVKGRAPLGEQVEQAGRAAEDAARLAGRVVVPVTGAAEVGAAVALAVVALAVVQLRRRPSAPASSEVRTWLWRLGGAGAAAVAGWLPHVPAAYWTPLKPGLEDRVNVVASLGLAVAVVALLRLAGLVVAPGRRRLAVAVTALSLSAIGVGYAARFDHDAEAWVAAGRERRAVLETVDAVAGGLAPGSRVYVLGVPGPTGPGVPVFAFSYDLWGAVRTRTDPSADAHPVLDGARFACEADGVRALRLPSPTYESDLVAAAGATSAYGATWFVDVDRATATRIDDEASCRAFVRSRRLA